MIWLLQKKCVNSDDSCAVLSKRTVSTVSGICLRKYHIKTGFILIRSLKKERKKAQLNCILITHSFRWGNRVSPTISKTESFNNLLLMKQLSKSWMTGEQQQQLFSLFSPKSVCASDCSWLISINPYSFTPLPHLAIIKCRVISFLSHCDTKQQC